MASAPETVGRVGISRMTPAELSLRGKIGSAIQKSRHDARALTAAARETFLAKFLDEVDPERKLDEGERLRRAEFARKAYFARLAYKSARARRKGAER